MSTWWNGHMISEYTMTDEELQSFAANPFVPPVPLRRGIQPNFQKPATIPITQQLSPVQARRKARELPCVHLGESTGRIDNCITCGGKKQIEIFKCAIFGECTRNDQLTTQETVPSSTSAPAPAHLPNQFRKLKTYAWCLTCTKYEVNPANLPKSPTPEPPQRPPPKPIRWVYGVTTVPARRRELLPRTLQSLKAGGFDRPWLFIDRSSHLEAASYEQEFGLRIAGVTVRSFAAKVYANWVLSLWELYLRDPDADRYAIFQDDMVTYRNLRPYLEKVVYPPRGYLNLYTFPENQVNAPRVKGKEVIGWFPSNQRGFGAVALVFSSEAVRTLLTNKHLINRTIRNDPENLTRRVSLVDGAVVEAFRGIGWREYVHNPSLVQHTGEQSSMGHGLQPLAPSFKGEDFDALELLQHMPVAK
jgi:hypothetical protein